MIDNNGNVNGRFRTGGPVRLVSPDDAWYSAAGGYGRNAYREGNHYRGDLNSVMYSPNGKVNFANLLGYTAEEFDAWPGQSGEISRDQLRDGFLNSFLSLDQSQEAASQNATNLTKGIMAAFDVEGDPNQVDLNNRAPNGSWNLFEMAAYKLYLDGADGKKDGVIHVADAKKAKEHLAQLASSDKQEDQEELLKINREASDMVFDDFHSANNGAKTTVDQFNQASETLKAEEKKEADASPQEAPDSEGTAGSAAGTPGSGNVDMSQEGIMKRMQFALQLQALMQGANIQLPPAVILGYVFGQNVDMSQLFSQATMQQPPLQDQDDGSLIRELIAAKREEARLEREERAKQAAAAKKAQWLQIAMVGLGSIFGASQQGRYNGGGYGGYGYGYGGYGGWNG